MYRYRTGYVDTLVGDTWTYNLKDYTVGRLDKRTIAGVESGNLSTTTYSYLYTKFGQLKREGEGSNAAAATSYVAYEYLGNGLLERKTDNEVLANGEPRTLESFFKYDINGRRIEETHTTHDYTTRQVVTATPLGPRYNSEIQRTESTQTTHYEYDALGRMTQVRSPAGEFKTQLGERPTTDLEAINYRYDEWGNRRSIETIYTKPYETESDTKIAYFTYDAEGRTYVANGYRENGYIVAGEQGGTVYTYDDAGRVQTEERWVDTVEQEQNTASYGPPPIPVAEEFQVRRHIYNDLGLLDGVERSSVQRALDQNHRCDVQSATGFGVVESYKYDDLGVPDQRGDDTSFKGAALRYWYSWTDLKPQVFSLNNGKRPEILAFRFFKLSNLLASAALIPESLV